MSGLENTVKRLANASMGRGYATNRERREKKKAKRQAALNKIYEGAFIWAPLRIVGGTGSPGNPVVLY